LLPCALSPAEPLVLHRLCLRVRLQMVRLRVRLVQPLRQERVWLVQAFSPWPLSCPMHAQQAWRAPPALLA
jgi:hypothetical protein